MAKLVVKQGRNSGKEVLLGEKERVVVGRRSSNDLQVLDAKASRNHSEVIREGSTFILRDLKSRNGTLLNGQKVTSDRELEFGDEVRIGDCVIAFVDEEAGKPITVEMPGYEMIARVGEGSMGTVYKAKQLSMDRVVALKILSEKYSSDESFIERFIKEARAAGKLSHPNLIHVHDVSKAAGRHYFSMELVDGTTVRKMLRKGPAEPKKAAEIVLQAARGLGYAHENNIIHRDVKPDNLMVDTDGQVKISDLGIARSIEEEEEEGRRRKVFGTPHYMAPEQALGKPIDSRADMYSLGATLYHMLAGETPFQGTEATEVLKAHVQTAPPDIREKNPNLPEVLAKIVEKMMAKAPDRRYEKMLDLIFDLQKFIEEGPDTVPAPAAAAEKKKEKPEKKPRRRREAPGPMPGWMTASVASAVVVGLAVLGLGTYYLVNKLKKPEDGAPRTLRRAERDERAGRLDAAREGYRRLLDKYRGSPEAAIARTALDRLAKTTIITPSAASAAELATEAKGREAEGDLEGAREIWQRIVDDDRDAPEAAEARVRIEELTRLIGEKREKDAARLLSEAEAFAQEQGDDLAGQISRYKKVLDDYPQTPAAAKARARLNECQKRLQARQDGRVQTAYTTVKGEVSTRRGRGDYDGAIQELDAFIARYSDHAGFVQQAKATRAETKAEIERTYAAVERGARDDARKRFYGMALEKLNKFIKNYNARELKQKALALKTEIDTMSREDFENAVKEPNKFVRGFEFDGATNLYKVLDNLFRGTRWQFFAKNMIGKIEKQKKLHEMVVDRLNETWEEYQGTKDLTKLGRAPKSLVKGRATWYVASADVDRVTVRAGPGGNLTLAQDRPWKSLKIKDTWMPVYNIYQVAFPFDKCDAALHEMFDFFCQERDLVEEADKHNEAYKGKED